MNESAVNALADILNVSRGEARAVIKALRDRGFRVWSERVREDVARRREAALIDGDDTELRAVFGEPVEGRDFTRNDGEAGT